MPFLIERESCRLANLDGVGPSGVRMAVVGNRGWFRCVLVVLAGAMGLAGMAVQAAEAPKAGPAAAVVTPVKRPWFETRLKTFFAAKSALAHELADQENEKLSPEIWTYFDAGTKGDWNTVSNLWVYLKQRSSPAGGAPRDDGLMTIVWQPLVETALAWEQYSRWDRSYFMGLGAAVVGSVPEGCIFLAGSDAGRGMVGTLSGH